MIDPNGNPIKGKQFQMVSIRDGIKIPLQYESGGIRKIVACLGALIAAYNNESVLAVIDGFDSNIFEYLFGEIVSVFSDSGTGQFIFTSHNLRPLEVLGNHGIYLTTTDPNDRYAEYPYTKDTVNFRSKYLRDIKLDSKLTTSSNTREFYSPTNEDDIRHAFTLAGVRNELIVFILTQEREWKKSTCVDTIPLWWRFAIFIPPFGCIMSLRSRHI